MYRRDGSLVSDQVSNYDPPATGVHLCGVTDDDQQPTTVATYCAPADKARDLWRAARAVAECSKDEADFVVDLFVDDQVEDDFWSNRQLWPRAIASWNALSQASPS
jgi:hypothetical protein